MNAEMESPGDVPTPNADTEWIRQFIEAGQFVLPSNVEPEELISRMQHAVGLVVKYGGHEGASAKAWILDQVVRALTGDDYKNVVARAKAGEDGPETYDWDTGSAP